MNRSPTHLSTAARRWHAEVAKLFAGLDPHERSLLEMAASALDRCEGARKTLAKEGVIVHDRFGQQKVHPAHAVLVDERRAFVQICRELNLSEDEASAPSRPPRIPGRYGR